ncbi:MAG: phosphomannomutase/phosphoglucomutase [Propionibacteriaceae bacterium]
MITPDIFKANDIRGIAVGPGAQWDTDGATALGSALVGCFDLHPGDRIVLGRDMRTTSVELSGAFAAGVTRQGVHVVDIGLSSTDGLWFASGRLDLPGAMFTASHNPGSYNGIKFCRPGARPVDPGLLLELARRSAQDPPAPAAEPGTVESRDLLADYAAHLHALVDVTGLRPLRVVVDTGNGMGGHVLPAVLGADSAVPTGIELIGLYLDLDGAFPNHAPNPLEPENLVDAQAAVREHDADLALVFDGDADRCFIIDERGEVVSPSAVTAMIAASELAREPGSTIVINTIVSRAVPELIERLGGRVVQTKVGHTFVKAAMAEHQAVFGGEHSAHYYFRDFWGADTGMLAALHVLATLGHQDRPLSELVVDFNRYAASGEINSRVLDTAVAMDQVAAAYDVLGEIDRTDGLTVQGDQWRFNLRGSNTEPLIRLNVEASDEDTMVRFRDEVLQIVRADSHRII